MRAESGDAAAQNSVGVAYGTGRGVEISTSEAVKWFRKAAEQGHAIAQGNLGDAYNDGDGVQQDRGTALQWYMKAAKGGDAQAQFRIANAIGTGDGFQKNDVEAAKWMLKSASNGFALAEAQMGRCYINGLGVQRNPTNAVIWFTKAAEQGDANAQFWLAMCYKNAWGVPRSYVEAQKWLTIASAQGEPMAAQMLGTFSAQMSPMQLAEAQRQADGFRPRQEGGSGLDAKLPSDGEPQKQLKIAGTIARAAATGFFVTDDGYFITNEHVASAGSKFQILTDSGLIVATVIKVDAVNDLALFKSEGHFEALPVDLNATVSLGDTLVNIGFPNPHIQGIAPKFAKGEVTSLAGWEDNPRFFQMSVPGGPGNSGGALADMRGNVVGVFRGSLTDKVMSDPAFSGQHINYGVKGSGLAAFLASVPEVSRKLKPPVRKEQKLQDVIKAVEKATRLVVID